MLDDAAPLSKLRDPGWWWGGGSDATPVLLQLLLLLRLTTFPNVSKLSDLLCHPRESVWLSWRVVDLDGRGDIDPVGCCGWLWLWVSGAMVVVVGE